MTPQRIQELAREPRRAQVTGDLFHGQVPAGAVYVGRAAPGLPASPYRNPHRVKELGWEESLRRYRQDLDDNPALLEQARAELAGRDLACWCRPPLPCHVDVLLEIANRSAS